MDQIMAYKGYIYARNAHLVSLGNLADDFTSRRVKRREGFSTHRISPLIVDKHLQ